MVKRNIERFIYLSFGFLVYVIASFLTNWNHYITGFFILLAASGLYFAYAIRIDQRNFMSFKALFSLTWLGAAGLSSLRLTDYQVPWEMRTWYLMGAAYVFLVLGIYFGETLFPRLARKFDLSKARCFQGNKKIVYGLKKGRLFWLVLTVTLISLASLIINIHIKGYLPFFSSDSNAYLSFYTRWYTFIFAGTAVVGLAYYCVRKLELSKIKKIIMYLCISYLILMPILVVSRGAFITASLSLSAAIFFLHKKKFWVLMLCFVFIFGGYQVGSMARNLTGDYLNSLFQPKEIVISDDGGAQNQSEQPSITDENPSKDENPSEKEETKTMFQLPSSVVFFYTYLTVGCDNFNHAVVNSEKLAYGVHQLVPFNVILRSSYISEKVNTSEMYFIRPYLNTGDLFTDAYYDFHVLGIVIFGLLWGISFGIIEAYFLKYQTPCSFIVFGNTLPPVFLCFFQTWMSLFPQWIIWGTAFLVFVFSSFTLQKTKAK